MYQDARKLVLIVEDDPDIRDVLSEFLQEEGFLVTTAENGKEALDLLSCIKRPCVILLDVFMPIIDGHQFLKRLSRLHPHLSDVPIVAMSAGETQPMGVPLIAKPFSLRDIEAALQAHCGLPERAAREAPALFDGAS